MSIKVIAYDFVGVLVTEKDIKLTDEEFKLERMFGDNLDDSDYIIAAEKIISKKSHIVKITDELIAKLYQIKNESLLKIINDRYPSIKQIIATNHISFIKKFIENNFDKFYLDKILISAEIHKIKPNADFYNYILEKYHIEPKELLFIDDNKNNIEAANNLGIQTILVNDKTDLLNEILTKLI